MLQTVDVDRRPVHGVYTVPAVAYHVSGMIKVGFSLNNGPEVFQLTPVDGMDTSDFNDDVVGNWQGAVFDATFDTAALDFSDGPMLLVQVAIRTYAVDGLNRVQTINYLACENAVAPTETKYVSITTNSPSNSNDGSAAHPWLTLDYARTNIADGGTIKCVDAGNYTMTRAVSFRANEKYITITTDLDQDEVVIVGDGGNLTPKVQWLSFVGVTISTTSFAQFDGGDGGNSRIWMDNVLATGAWQDNTTGPGNHAWIALGQGDYWWFTGCTAYNTVWGLSAPNGKLINCLIDKLSGVPFQIPELIFNTVVSNFNPNYLNDSPNPTPIGSNPSAQGSAFGYVGALNGGINDSVLTMVVASATGTGGFPLPGAGGSIESYPYYLQIDSEIIKVTSRTTTTLTIERAQRSTSPASHSNAAVIYSLDPVYHRDICHYGYHGVEHRIAYGMRTADDVSATMFRIEALPSPDGYFLDLLWLNCEMDGEVDATNSGGVHSDMNGQNTNVIWHNVWNPTNPWEFTFPSNGNPWFSATDVYFIDCGLHYRNFLPWVLGISNVGTGALPPAGVTITDGYEPAKGLQPLAAPMTATLEPTGIRFTWTPSGWPDRDRADFRIYNTITQELEVEFTFVSTSGDYLYTDAEEGVPYAGLIIESNTGSGEIRYGQTAINAIYFLIALGTNGQGFTITLTRIPAGTASFQWNASNSQVCTMLSLSNTSGTLQTATAIFESA